MKQAAGWLLLSLGILASCGKGGTAVPPPASMPAVPKDVPEEAHAVLAAPESLEILALHPSPHEPDGKPTGPSDDFHGYRILGRASITDDVERRTLLAAVYEGIENPHPPAACFNPRHGIRATSSTGSVDLVICFECDTVFVYAPLDAAKHTFVPTSRAPEPTLDAVLRNHGLEKHRAAPR